MVSNERILGQIECRFATVAVGTVPSDVRKDGWVGAPAEFSGSGGGCISLKFGHED